MKKNHFRIIQGIVFLVLFAGLCIVKADPVSALSLALVPPLSFGDLIINDGEDNMGGTQLIAYYALESEVRTLPAMAANPDSLEEYGTVAGSFVMIGDAVFKKLYASPNTGKIDDAKVDGNDSNGYESTYEFFFPSTSAQSIGFQRISGTSKYIVVVVENNGQKRIIGSKPGCPAVLSSAASTTDVTSGGAHGTTFSFKSYQNGPAPAFTGLVPLVVTP